MDRVISQKFRPYRGGNTVEITMMQRDEGTIVSVGGRIDTMAAPDLEQAITREIGEGNRKILIDLSRVPYISSGGLRVLLATAKKLKLPGDKFGLCNPAPEVLKILKLTGFTSIFPIFSSEGEAFARW
jgi:anti-sigma B factor antagonist